MVEPVKAKRKERVKPKRVSMDAEIPARSRNDFWAHEIAEARKHPGKTFQYEAHSSTTSTYLKGRYGVVATTRTRSNGVIDLFVQYPAKSVNGELVADEAKVQHTKDQYAKENT